MKEVVCAGCSFTNFDTLDKKMAYDGITPCVDGVNPMGSYPESIHRSFKNKVYNLGMAGNNIATSVLSLITTADRLLKEKKDIFLILQCTEFTRKSFYLPSNFQIIKNIGVDDAVRNNNYLFDEGGSGFFQFGNLAEVGDRFSSIQSIKDIAKSYSKYIYSVESGYIDSLTHILLLQNYCKVNKIPYKVFLKTESFSIPFYPLFSIPHNSNVDDVFNAIFIKKKLFRKNPLTFINSDPYIKNLFGMLDFDNFWFTEDVDCKYGGITEWVYKRNQYNEGDETYIPLVVEDIDEQPIKHTYQYSIQRAKDKIKNGTFNPNGHPSYYYWDLFVKNEISKWGILS